MRRILLASSLILFASTAMARSMPSMRTLPSTHPTFTYDVSASSGTENNNTYSEVKLGLNWYLTDWLNWRNAVFTRFGSNVKSANGLDSSLLASYEVINEERTLGFQAFVGPGVRIASEDNNAATATAGVIFTLGGIKLGGGAQYLSYFKTRKDTVGEDLPKAETQYFVVLSGGGSF
ncbi:hypothetical protein [Bdellovibrio sp. HCB337]|uniref:hypothetical protein n=1 Tax=Bdellovibrio sp. HCB337 TaxID=3394358 RepID=UPI0039A47167